MEGGLETLRRTYPFVGTLGRVPAPCGENARTLHGPNRSPSASSSACCGLGVLPVRSTFDYKSIAPPLLEDVGIIGAGPAGYQAAMLRALVGIRGFCKARALPEVF